MKKLVGLQRVILLLVSVMFACTNVVAQHLSGSVLDSLGNPIANAEIVELGSNHRVINYAKSNNKGLFTISLSNSEVAHISIKADGYVQLTAQVIPDQTYKVTMQKKQPSRLQQLREKYQGVKHKAVLSNKLLCGRYHSREVPWLVMLEHIGDDVYALHLPVKTETEYGQYREGRMAVVETSDLQHLLELYNAEENQPVDGSPNEKETWDRFTGSNTSVLTHWSWYSDDFDKKILYYYPTFILTQSELEMLIEKSSDINRILLDNEAADNFWIMYPMKGFAKELKKAMQKVAF